MFVLPGVVKQQWGGRDRGQIGLWLQGSHDHAVSAPFWEIQYVEMSHEISAACFVELSMFIQISGMKQRRATDGCPPRKQTNRCRSMPSRENAGCTYGVQLTIEHDPLCPLPFQSLRGSTGGGTAVQPVVSPGNVDESTSKYR